MIDSGAGGKFIDQNFAKRFDIKKMDKPLKAYNVDGTENKRGTIKHYVDLKFKIGKRNFVERLLVTGLGKQKIILGFPCIRKNTLSLRHPQDALRDSQRFLELSEH